MDMSSQEKQEHTQRAVTNDRITEIAPPEPQPPVKAVTNDRVTEIAPPEPKPAVYAQPGDVRPHDMTELMPEEAPTHDTTMAWLIIVSQGEQYGQMIRLRGKSTVIGRATDCAVVLNDSALSRQHAKIRVEQQADTTDFVIHDLATSNGTFVNGTKQQSVKLKNGDVIRIGRTEMIFKYIT